MRSLVKSGPDTADTFVTDRPIPELRGGDVLMRVEACGLCGSDLHAWRSDPGYEWVKPPVVLGHEFVGTVVAAAPDVDGWGPGDRAVVVSIQGCMDCDACRAGRTNNCLSRAVIGLSFDGGMSQFVRVGVPYLVPVPASMKADVAAAVEPLSVAAHATLTIGRVTAGQQVVVSGAGFVGIACSLLAMDAGADVLLVGAPQDAESRLPAATALGVPTRVIDEDDWDEPDVWIEASGAAPAFTAAIERTRTGGLVSVVGMYSQPPTKNLSLLVRRELEVRGCYASVAPEYTRVIELLAQGRLHVESLLQTFDLEDAATALGDAATARALKPILIPK
ncbi:MAG: zinc-dependent alcohol dehydrogenase, partial [Candidatus Nanopelagicales bacterium]